MKKTLALLTFLVFSIGSLISLNAEVLPPDEVLPPKLANLAALINSDPTYLRAWNALGTLNMRAFNEGEINWVTFQSKDQVFRSNNGTPLFCFQKDDDDDNWFEFPANLAQLSDDFQSFVSTKPEYSKAWLKEAAPHILSVKKTKGKITQINMYSTELSGKLHYYLFTWDGTTWSADKYIPGNNLHQIAGGDKTWEQTGWDDQKQVALASTREEARIAHDQETVDEYNAISASMLPQMQQGEQDERDGKMRP